MKTSTPTADARQTLRKRLRALRRALTPHQQHQAALHLARRLNTLPELHRARHIALYIANDGEIDPAAFARVARARGKHCYLPILHPILKNRLWFCRVGPNDRLHLNRFGIPEPDLRTHPRRPAWSLDCVLLPLVGFDAQGGRMGMGGGFYDRTFAFTRIARRPQPHLIGLAHAGQRVETLPLEPWDVVLQAIVTDRGHFMARHGSRQALSEESERRVFGRVPGHGRHARRRDRRKQIAPD